MKVDITRGRNITNEVQLATERFEKSMKAWSAECKGEKHYKLKQFFRELKYRIWPSAKNSKQIYNSHEGNRLTRRANKKKVKTKINFHGVKDTTGMTFRDIYKLMYDDIDKRQNKRVLEKSKKSKIKLK